ncbi:MAG: M16 family metallopeptidase [Minisyncoccota bacterium]
MRLTKELDGLGAQSNAFTGQEFTGYFAKAAARALPTTIDVVADIYLNSTFPKEEIEKEKGVIVQEINMYEDMPQRHVHDLFMEVVYGDQPAGRTIVGTREIVTTLTREDFIAYRKKNYVPNATVVVIAGGFNEADIKKRVRVLFGGAAKAKKQSKKKVVDMQVTPAVRLLTKKTDQTHLVLGVRSRSLFHKDHFALEVLAGVLGGGMSSRLFQKIREDMGAAYYVRAWDDAFTDHGVLCVSVGAGNEHVHDVVRAVLAEMKTLTQDLVPKDELAKIKRYLAGHILLELEGTDALANFYGGQEVLTQKILTPKDVVAKLHAVTAEDIRRVARSIFVEKNINLALIGPFEKKEEFEKLLVG